MRQRVQSCATLSLLALVTLLSQAPQVHAQDLLGAGGGTSAITTSNAGPNPQNGLNINTLVGADRFYNAGYTGTRAVIGNVEGGHIWNGHETLTGVTTYVDARSIPPYSTNNLGSGQLGSIDFHATYVGQILAGRDNGLGNTNLRTGIASGSSLWSGAIATSWNSPQVNQGDFQWNSGFAFAHPYTTFALTGVAGRTADVINSSWSFFDPANPNGTDNFTNTLDGIARQSRTPIVFAAGNFGPTPDTVDAPGVGHNLIVVGATTGDGTNPAYGSVANFSARGPSGYTGPTTSPNTFEIVPGVRARVDIVAPGTNMTLAQYGGQTGGNAGAPNDPTGGAINQYVSNISGTSLAAPIVSGGVALLADVAYDRYAANIDNATDGNVMKAVLLNSADKLTGWTNNLAANGQGVLVTTQALDYNQGAGQVNLNKAFDQFTAGVTDVAGTTGGTNLATIGWDWGTVLENGFNDYSFATSLVAGSTMSATLNWYVNTSFNGILSNGVPSTSYGSFTNLALEVYQVTNGNPLLIAQSDAGYIATEHLFFSVPTTGDYFLRVRWTGERYDFINSTSQNYGLAWSVTGNVSASAPEPGVLVLFSVGLVAFGVVRRRNAG